MPDVQARAARVRKHIEHVKFWPSRIEAGISGIDRAEGVVSFPELLPFRLDLIERILLSLIAHFRKIESGKQENRKRRNFNKCDFCDGERDESGKQESRKKA